MLRTIKKQGFTLIELMVVIVIIGVLASLAIPRFSEASDKAKVAEAPRILASFESAYLAAQAEQGDSIKTADDIIFDTTTLSSKWFGYGFGREDDLIKGFGGKAKSNIGKIKQNAEIWTADTAGGVFVHCFKDDGWTGDGDEYVKLGKKYVPNFLQGTTKPDGCDNVTLSVE